MLADAGVVQDVQALGESGHNAVLDAVMHHLHEVARAVGAAVQVALFGSAANFLASGRALHGPDAGSQRLENRVKMLDDLFLAADHLAVTAVETPDAAAGAAIDIVDVVLREFFRAPDIVLVVRVAAVDDD